MSWVEESRRVLGDGTPAIVLRLKAKRIGLEAHPAEVKADVLAVIAEDAKAVVLDLEEVRFAGTNFLAVLLGIQKWLAIREKSLRLCNLAPVVEESLRLCQLHKIMNIYPTLEAALG